MLGSMSMKHIPIDLIIVRVGESHRSLLAHYHCLPERKDICMAPAGRVVGATAMNYPLTVHSNVPCKHNAILCGWKGRSFYIMHTHRQSSKVQVTTMLAARVRKELPLLMGTSCTVSVSLRSVHRA